MKSTRLLFAIAAIATLSSCRFHPTHVPLRGSDADIARLAGKWDGEYSSVASGRAGSIFFEIVAGNDTAHGDVLMTPNSGQRPHAVDAGTSAHEAHVRTFELLQVAFVRIDGGSVRGVLEPYIAPDCQCTVTTEFRGTLNGDAIAGTFTTRGAYSLLQEGTWRVVRR